MDEAGLSRDSVRAIYDGRDIQWTSAANILSALELELYVGPHRDLDGALLLPEALESAAAFERIARGVMPEAEALAELVKIHLKLLRKARRKHQKKLHRNP